ncbi:MAG TPA: peptidoglycan DD-metalloendopeptidase family protein [Beijerinckiaceae bacterium]|nr:peptidoglycan DD-metalloendopeptidase family protein [Beijerinckiaceae bacterium]
MPVAGPKLRADFVRRNRCGRFCLAVMTLLLAVGLAAAQAPPAGEATPQGELRQVLEKIQRSEAEQSRLRSEITGLKGDRAQLNKDLLASTVAVREAEVRIGEAQARLNEVTASEQALKQSLEARRGVITEVLATLQRMGRRSPPAVLVRPEDMLEAIRSAILLGHVVPDIKAEAEQLAADLSELVRLRRAAAAERQRLQGERDRIEAERTRLAGLIDARQSQIESSEKALGDERGRLDGMARQAQTLKDLIARLEQDAASMQRVQEQAKKAPSPAQSQEDATRLAALAFRDPARLAPKIAFQDARGLLALPTNGPVIKVFGAADGFGGSERGITIAAQPGHVVTAPSDGWILFAGPYRSYGRILIINAGNGYNFVLTGLQSTSVEPGQFVLAGEPVGMMGSPALEAARTGDGQPATSHLYVELRKDNQPIDPTPWWAKATNEKARG